MSQLKEPNHSAYLQWDVATWSPAIDLWIEGIQMHIQGSGQALEIGGRQGGLSLFLAEQGIKVICSDLVDTQSLASPIHMKFNVGHLVTYERLDATDLPFEEQFDVVVFKSVLGGIGHDNQKSKQDAAMAAMYRALKPGGLLLFAENMRAGLLHRIFRRFVKWGGAWRYVSQSELQQWLRPYSTYTLRYTGFIASFGRTEKQRQVFSTIDRLLFLWWIPKSWMYVGYGVAKK
jgi:SAM-dependent methyltransferase